MDAILATVVEESLQPILESLCHNPKGIATLLLNQFFGILEGFSIEGQERPLINPWLCIIVSPRRIMWETCKWGDIIRQSTQRKRTLDLGI